MADSKNSGKSLSLTPSFRFNAKDEELEELLEETDPDASSSHQESTEDLHKDASPNKDIKKKSFDESPGTSDTWRKIHEFKGKITKTFEGKLLEITDKKDKKISKENSVSDSEDNSETSKVSAEAESSPKKGKIKQDVVKLSDIKISEAATADSLSESVMIEPAEEVGEDFENEAVTSDSQNNEPPDEDINYLTILGKVFKSIYKNENLFYTVIGVLVLLVTPLPSFAKGFILGATCVFLSSVLLTVLGRKLRADPKYLKKGKVDIPDFNKLPLLKIPTSVRQPGVWFNEYLWNYDPNTYTVSQTLPVYFELEGNIITLSRPSYKVNKRATFNEPTYDLKNFVDKRNYNIKDCTILLLPDGLAKKRLWSKKYPIVIKLNVDSLIDKTKRDTRESLPDLVAEAEDNTSDIEEEITDTSSLVNNNNLDKTGDKLYLNLFARCDRQKEEWYRRLLAATKATQSPLFESLPLRPPTPSTPVNSEDGDDKSGGSDTPTTRSGTPIENISVDPELLETAEYLRHMAKFVESENVCLGENSSTLEKVAREMRTSLIDIQWFNALVNRVLFDLLRSPHWISQLQVKLQRKLSTLRLPYYVEEIILSELNLGSQGPVFHRISQPVLDECGVWVDLDMAYEGYVRTTIETHLNLIKLQKGYTEAEAGATTPPEKKSAAYDSDLEDSAESSDDDDEEHVVKEQTPFQPNYQPTRTSSKKLLRLVETVAQSKYFQHVAQSKYVQRAIEGVSKTKLKLKVEVRGLVGTLVVNIPPPPSDRLWYGFRGMPKLWLSAQPKFGERTVSFNHITNWIEKKLIQEFQKLLVMPNMDDFIIPVAPGISPSTTFQAQHSDSEDKFTEPEEDFTLSSDLPPSTSSS